MTPFEYCKHINKHERLNVESREYSQYIVNTFFSMFADTIIQANQVNCLAGIDPQMHFDYLFHTVRPRNRFKKWPKKKADPAVLRAVSDYYKYNRAKARDALQILTAEQADAIKNKYEIGA